MFQRNRSASPADLLEQLQAHQNDHREAIADANRRLIDSHNAVLSVVVDRKQAIDEQVKLLTAEKVGLDKVHEVAASRGTMVQ